MVITEEDITTFQELYLSEFGMEITKEFALAKGTQLLNLMSAICKPEEIKSAEIINK